MKKAEFDKFADEYSSIHALNIAISGESPDFFAEYKIIDLAKEYFSQSYRDISAPVVLDFGSGIGNSVPYIRKYIPKAQITCMDVSKKSLEIGESRFCGLARFIHYKGAQFPFTDRSVDIVLSACVFHHIDHEEHFQLIKEFNRILVRGGIAIVFEYNPNNPLTVKAVNTCVFDENAKLIKANTLCKKMIEVGFNKVKIRYRIFFPHSLRYFRPLEKYLIKVPLGAQYYVISIK